MGEQRAEGGPHLVKARFWSVVDHARSVNTSQEPAKNGAFRLSCTASSGLDMADVNTEGQHQTELGGRLGHYLLKHIFITFVSEFNCMRNLKLSKTRPPLNSMVYAYF